MLYEAAARVNEVLALNVEALDLVGRPSAPRAARPSEVVPAVVEVVVAVPRLRPTGW